MLVFPQGFPSIFLQMQRNFANGKYKIDIVTSMVARVRPDSLEDAPLLFLFIFACPNLLILDAFQSYYIFLSRHLLLWFSR